jgi:hypothetical protein
MTTRGPKLKEKRTLSFKRFIIIFAVCALASAILVDASGSIFLKPQSNPPTNQVGQDTTDNYITSNNTIGNLTDVEVLGIKNGQLLFWNATAEKWQNADTSQSVSTLAKLTDATSANISNVDPNNPQQPYSYLIYSDGASNYYAKNGTDGTISFKSTNATYVIQSAINQEGTIAIKTGTYFGTSLSLSDLNVRLIGEGQNTILHFTDGITISNTEPTHKQEISNLALFGSGYTKEGLTLNSAQRFISYNLFIQKYSTGVYITSTVGATIFNNFYSLMSYDNFCGVHIKRNGGGDDTVAHNTFYGGRIVTNLKWGVVIEGSASHEVFDGVEIENNMYGQVLFNTLAAGGGLVPEGNQFVRCYFEPEPSNNTSPFIKFTTQLGPGTEAWGNSFTNNKFAIVGTTSLTLGSHTIFSDNYITGASVTFTVDASATCCVVDGNINPTGTVTVKYIGTANTGRVMVLSNSILASSGSWINFTDVFPANPAVSVSVTNNGNLIFACPYQVEMTRFQLLMSYSNGTEVTTPQLVVWTATLNLP